MPRRSRIILHGKQGANQELRDAVEAVRADGGRTGFSSSSEKLATMSEFQRC